MLCILVIIAAMSAALVLGIASFLVSFFAVAPGEVGKGAEPVASPALSTDATDCASAFLGS